MFYVLFFEKKISRPEQKKQKKTKKKYMNTAGKHRLYAARRTTCTTCMLKGKEDQKPQQNM